MNLTVGVGTSITASADASQTSGSYAVLSLQPVSNGETMAAADSPSLIGVYVQ